MYLLPAVPHIFELFINSLIVGGCWLLLFSKGISFDVAFAKEWYRKCAIPNMEHIADEVDAALMSLKVI